MGISLLHSHAVMHGMIYCDVDAFEGEGLAWEWNGLGNGLFEGPGGQRGRVGHTGLY